MRSGSFICRAATAELDNSSKQPHLLNRTFAVAACGTVRLPSRDIATPRRTEQERAGAPELYRGRRCVERMEEHRCDYAGTDRANRRPRRVREQQTLFYDRLRQRACTRATVAWRP